MFMFEENANAVQDREDLLAVLRMRFGDVPPKVIEEIYQINELDTLERLILVAANSPNFNTFLEELNAGSGSFKILGERFNPINLLRGKGV